MSSEGDAIWYYVENGGVVGPVTTADLVRLVGEKKISIANTLSRDLFHWFPAIQLPVLRASLEWQLRERQQGAGCMYLCVLAGAAFWCLLHLWPITNAIIRQASPSLAARWNLLDSSTAYRLDNEMHWTEIQSVLSRLLAAKVTVEEFAVLENALPDWHSQHHGSIAMEAVDFKTKLRAWLDDVQIQARLAGGQEQFLETLLDDLAEARRGRSADSANDRGDLRRRFRDLIDESEVLRQELEMKFGLMLPTALVRGTRQ